MWPKLRWGWVFIIAIIAAMAVFAIAERATGHNARHNCEASGGRVEEYDCPQPRTFCTSNGRSSVCTDRPCPWRCRR